IVTRDAGERVAFSFQLPIQGQPAAFAEGWESRAGAQALATVARVAERAGFAAPAVADHVAVAKSRAPTVGTTWWDCVAALAYLAAVTERIRLLSHVYVLPLRHPLLAAKQWTTLDALSGGRTILGVGAGDLQ